VAAHNRLPPPAAASGSAGDLTPSSSELIANINLTRPVWLISAIRTARDVFDHLFDHLFDRLFDHLFDHPPARRSEGHHGCAAERKPL
jgi:hypothetical protein